MRLNDGGPMMGTEDARGAARASGEGDRSYGHRQHRRAATGTHPLRSRPVGAAWARERRPTGTRIPAVAIAAGAPLPSVASPPVRARWDVPHSARLALPA